MRRIPAAGAVPTHRLPGRAVSTLARANPRRGGMRFHAPQPVRSGSGAGGVAPAFSDLGTSAPSLLTGSHTAKKATRRFSFH